MKQKIILHNIYLPLLWIILSLTNYFISKFPFSKWVGIGLVIGSLIWVGFNSDKHLTEVSLKEEKLEFHWFTAFLNHKTTKHDINEIIEIIEMNFLKRNFIS